MLKASPLATILSQAPVVPVIQIEDVADAVPLARALLAGGVRVLEVTLRTEAVLEAIRRIQAEVPDAIVGAGTVLTPAQLNAVATLEAAFAVSPGATPASSAQQRAHPCRCCRIRPPRARSWRCWSAATPT